MTSSEASMPMAGDFRVSPYDGPPDSWDRFVIAQSGWTGCRRAAWKWTLKRVFGHPCYYLAATNTAELQGVLPLVEVRSVIFGRYLVSTPFVSYGGQLGSAPALAALAQSAVELAGTRNCKLFELRSRIDQPLDLLGSHRKVRVVLDLPASPDRLWQGLGYKLPRQVKRPQKEGMEVRFGRDQIGSFHQVFSRHIRDVGTSANPVRFLQVMQEELGFHWENEFELTWASSLVAHQKVVPSMLLCWAFLERCAQQGIGLFNFGRCISGSEIHRFKHQWGFGDESLWWYQSTRSGESDATLSPHDALYSGGPKLWRHLPVGLARALGPRITRGIP